MKYSFEELPINYHPQPNRFTLPNTQRRSQPCKPIIPPKVHQKSKKKLQLPKKLVKVKKINVEMSQVSKWDTIQQHLRLIHSKCKSGQIDSVETFMQFVSGLQTQGIVEIKRENEMGRAVQFLELKVLQSTFLKHHMNDFLEKDLEQELIVQKFRALRSVLASTLEWYSAKSSFDLIDQIIDQEYFSDLGKLQRLSNQRIKDLGSCDLDDQFKEDVQDINSAGKLDWIIQVDSIFNYKQRVKKLRPHFFSSNEYQMRSASDTHFKHSRESKTKAVPPYFCARQVNQKNKLLWHRLCEWQSEMRNTLRIYHLQIQNAKRNIQKKLNLS